MQTNTVVIRTDSCLGGACYWFKTADVEFANEAEVEKLQLVFFAIELNVVLSDAKLVVIIDNLLNYSD